MVSFQWACKERVFRASAKFNPHRECGWGFARTSVNHEPVGEYDTMRHIRPALLPPSPFRILRVALCMALALVAASATATPGWTSAALTARNEYPVYANALRYPQNRLPYIFTNGNASASASTASSFTDGMIVLKSGTTKQIGNNSSLFYKLSDDPAGIDLKNVRITTSWNDSGRDQISISKLLVKTVAGGDVWSELPNSSHTSGTGKCNYQGVYADTDGTPVATGATDLCIRFGTQKNSNVGYTEIEAEIAFSSDVYLPLTVAPSALGSVTVSPTSPNNDGTYLLNSQVTLTATPAQGFYFYCWNGNAPAGHETDNPLTLTMDDITSLVPIFTPGQLTSPGWICTNITERNEYPEYANALRGRTPYIFTNDNKTATLSTASFLTDGTMKIRSRESTWIKNNASAFYKLSDDPAGISLKNIRITASDSDGTRGRITVSRLFLKTAAGGDTWIELPKSNYACSSNQKNWQATYADAAGALLAEDATDLWIYFGTSQQNSGVSYTEIEAEMELEAVKVDLSVNPSPYGTVAVSPASSTGDGKYPLDEVVTLTATPTSGFTFHAWTGDVPAGHAFDNPLILQMDDNKTVTPFFQGPWHYASNVMTDGYWRVTTSLSNGKRTITKVESIVPSPILDLRKETIGTDAPIVAVNNGVMSTKGWPVRDLRFPDTVTSIGDSCREMTSLTNLVLSANLSSLGHCAFYNCSALRHVTPLLPDTLVSTAGGDTQFSGAPLSGKLVISNKKFTTLGGGMFFGAWGLKEADLSRSGITSIPGNAFRESGITNIYLPSTVTSIGHCPFFGCTSLRSIYFASCPTTYDSEAVNGVSESMRIVIFKDDQDWLDYLAGLSSFKPWASLSASVKATYTFTDNCKPYGRVKIGSKGTEIFVATRSRPNIPLRIMLQ